MPTCKLIKLSVGLLCVYNITAATVAVKKPAQTIPAITAAVFAIPLVSPQRFPTVIKINEQAPAVIVAIAGRNTVAISETDVETFLAVSSKMIFVSFALSAAAAPSFRIFITVYPAPAHTKTTGIAKPHEIPNAAPAAIPIPSFNFIVYPSG